MEDMEELAVRSRQGALVYGRKREHMTRLTGIRRVFQEEHVHKSNHSISRSFIRLSVFIEVSVLDDRLEVSIDNERLIFRKSEVPPYKLLRADLQIRDRNQIHCEIYCLIIRQAILD
jgi:hypothetical protein